MSDPLFKKDEVSSSQLKDKLLSLFVESEEKIQQAVDGYESLDERTLEARVVLTHQLLQIIDDLLQADDWESSPFLKQLLRPTKELKEQLLQFLSENEGLVDSGSWSPRVCMPGYREVYLLMFQSDGESLNAWEDQLTDISSILASRAMYPTRDSIERVLRLRGGQDSDAYAALHIPSDFIMSLDEPNQDKWGQEILTLKSDNITSKCIAYFVHLSVTYDFVESRLVKVSDSEGKHGS